eukprot:CAMPEP_0174298542 /NCGR_PEP_ID=MMETSP0809-20121228/54091_1 /TAXON_ID=73025 ORGANISM="Eutreptiella gymnastica-like, Strain CCMP1594" /NCGR_SAMPLE_ID=MMETSP0809 /ASSEMBLY_ACC=CAM_ASM_000658 /LENGTH=53 /DNA_ID=CAMNT_0015403045 /DNA_START=399 /DNA_END=557 /DNA_ORIENTATION=-
MSAPSGDHRGPSTRRPCTWHPPEFLVSKDQTIGQMQRTGGQLHLGLNKHGLDW